MEFGGSTFELKARCSEFRGSTSELKARPSEFRGSTFELKARPSEFRGSTFEFSILHAPNYQIENDGALGQDWARVPLPENRETLIASAELGRRVAALLDPESSVTGVTSGKILPELQVIAIISRITEGNWNPEKDFALTAG